MTRDTFEKLVQEGFDRLPEMNNDKVRGREDECDGNI